MLKLVTNISQFKILRKKDLSLQILVLVTKTTSLETESEGVKTVYAQSYSTAWTHAQFCYIILWAA